MSAQPPPRTGAGRPREHGTGQVPPSPPPGRARGSTRYGQRFSPRLLLPSHLLLRSRTLFFLSLAATVALGVLAATAPEVLLRVDRPVSRIVHDESWVPFFRVVTEDGRPWAVAVLSVVAGITMWRHCRAFAIALPATALVALVADVVLKVLIDRPRPPFGVGEGADPTSFPSGHVVLGVIVLGLLVPSVYLMTERRWLYRAAVVLFFVYVPIVTLSRVVIGAHWFTDVVGSFCIGATFLLAAEYLVGSKFADEHCNCRLHRTGAAIRP